LSVHAIARYPLTTGVALVNLDHHRGLTVVDAPFDVVVDAEVVVPEQSTARDVSGGELAVHHIGHTLTRLLAFDLGRKLRDGQHQLVGRIVKRASSVLEVQPHLDLGLVPAASVRRRSRSSLVRAASPPTSPAPETVRAA